MTTVGKTMFPLANGIRNITSMKEAYDRLQTQLATGQKASTLAEMGSDRYFDLALRQRLARIDSYRQSITTVNLRLEVLDTVMTRLDRIEADARSAATSGGGTSGINYQTTPTLAASRLDEVLTLMNTNIAGRYMFGGSVTDKKPVQDPLTVLNGVGARAGFKQVANERKLADLGVDHLGRLDITAATDTVTLAEDGVHPFGLKLSTISTTSANITTASPVISPPQRTVQFGATLPIEGEKVQMNFTLPDGSEEQITLTATTGTPEPGQFQIGADAETTATNFAAALAISVKGLAEGAMSTASAYAAASNFFNGQGQAVMRVDGPPYDTATSLVAATPANTVLWYAGEDNADPRRSVTAKVGEGTSVGYGVQANESGFVDLVRTLAATAVQDFPDSDPTSAARYTALTARNASRLADTKDNNPGSLAAITVELGLALATAGAVDERHTAHKAQLGNMLERIETAPTEAVAMEILALKTRLEASYQTTALLSQLSLVNYMR